MIISTCFGQTWQVKQLPSYRTHSATLPPSETCLPQQQDTIPYVVKNPQFCAPEDGQKFARNMLSWLLEINKTVIVASRWFPFCLTYNLKIDVLHSTWFRLDWNELGPSRPYRLWYCHLNLTTGDKYYTLTLCLF